MGNKNNRINRITKRKYYLDIACAVSKRSTCLKYHYGAIIVKNDEIIATGYNGSPRGDVNCCDINHCQRMTKPHAPDYSDCCSVHAEQNAIISTSRDRMIGATMYLSCEKNDGSGNFVRTFEREPCPICKRMIKNSGIVSVVTTY